MFFTLVFIFSISCKPIYAQEPDNDIEEVVESQAEVIADESYDFSEMGESLNYFKKHPINLNTATKEQLSQLFFLTPQHINALISHRQTNGTFVDVLELQGISEIDPRTLEKILPFVTVKPDPSFSIVSGKDLLTRGGHDLMFRFGQVLEKQRGFKVPDSAGNSPGYQGSATRLFARYRYQYEKRLMVGITMEKDAGEAFFKGAQKYGFDFYSGFISYQGNSILRKMVVGDYSLQLGQGLTMWSGLGFGKGAVISTIAKSEMGLRPYSSANESLFLRGLSATIEINKLSITPFISYRYLDGNITSQDSAFSAISESGLHRTLSELDKKNSMTQFIYGTSASFNQNNLRIGTVLYRTEFNRPFEAGETGYKQFAFADDALTNLGVFYSYSLKNTFFFGEASHSLQSGVAYLSGLITSLTKYVSFSAVYRNYDKDYHSFFNQALSESSSAVNEKGLYGGLIITPDSKTELFVYSDLFCFPWLRYRVDAPSKGYEVLAQLTYSPSKRLNFLAWYKSENKEENSDAESSIRFLDPVKKNNFRGEVNYRINSSFQLRNRIEMVSYQKGERGREEGYLLYQDIIYSPLNSKLSGNVRFAIFDTDGFDSRIYAYERDVLYSYSLPGFQNRGIRFYLNGRYRVKRGVDIWIKYAITKYTNIDQVGSGLDLIDADQKSDLKAQIRMQF